MAVPARITSLCLRVLGVAGAFVAGACSSTPAAEPTPDASAGPIDAGDPGDAAEAGVALIPCGPAPHVQVELTVMGATTTGETPLNGATFSTPLCPGNTIASAGGGLIRGRLARDVRFYGRIETDGYIKMLTPEQVFNTDPVKLKITTLPLFFSALMPEFGPTKTAAFVQIAKGKGATGACANLDGVRISVPGHPEARLTYYTTDQIPAPIEGATETTASGRAAITELAAGIMVDLAAEKTGCRVTFVRDFSTGRIPTEAGYIVLTGADIFNASSDAGTD